MRLFRSLVLTHGVDPATSSEAILDWLAILERHHARHAEPAARSRRKPPTRGSPELATRVAFGAHRWHSHAALCLVMCLALVAPAVGQTRGVVGEPQGAVFVAEGVAVRIS